MTIEQTLKNRSGSKCELCAAETPLSVYDVAPSDGSADQAIMICEICLKQIQDPDTIDPNHWRCLNDSMWSAVPAVQVMAYRILKKMTTEGWPQDLLEMLYLDSDVQSWADADAANTDDGIVPGKDCNGAVLNAGDNVTLIKDLAVKGAGFTAKRGTLVKGISLTDSAAAIEGRVNGVRIVLKTCFLKKA